MHAAFLPAMLAAAPDIGLAAVFLIVWLAPEAAPAGTLTWLLLVMLLEFIIVHSSGFMGVPRFGLTREFVAGESLPSSGLWVDEPHRMVAFGFLYFAATAISELHGHRWIHPAHMHPSVGGAKGSRAA